MNRFMTVAVAGAALALGVATEALAQAKPDGNGGGDGLTVDVRGNLYITSGLGVQVFASSGQALGVIAFPEQPANCAFGGPENKTLYVTARTGLYAVPMEVPGHRFAVKRE